jgi:hypothetical protein
MKGVKERLKVRHQRVWERTTEERRGRRADVLLYPGGVQTMGASSGSEGTCSGADAKGCTADAKLDRFIQGCVSGVGAVLEVVLLVVREVRLPGGFSTGMRGHTQQILGWVPLLACNYYEGCICITLCLSASPISPPRHSAANKVSYPPSFFAAITTPLVNFISVSSQSSTQPSFATAPHWPQPGSGNARTATNLCTLPRCIT